MFEKKSDMPLWLHISIGVAVGSIVSGVVLYSLWLVHLRIEIDSALKHFGGTARTLPWQAPLSRDSPRPDVPKGPNQVAPPQVPQATPQGGVADPRRGACPAGYTVGVLNDKLVCVSPGGVVRAPG